MEWLASFTIPNLDPLIHHLYKEIMRWTADNVLAALIFTNVWAFLGRAAARSKNATDDKIYTWVTYIFTGIWRRIFVKTAK